MEHNQIPECIVPSSAFRTTAGQFHAVSIFVDVSGFTQLTSKLMEHGMEGAEMLAGLLGDILKPLMETIYAWQGYIVTLAGDAFVAVFPTERPQAYERATMAAWEINQHVLANPIRDTHVGTFPFSIKVSIADGIVDWGILQTNNSIDEHQRNNTRYYFIGEAIDRCLEIDQFALRDTVFLTTDVYDQLPTKLARADAIGAYWQLRSVNTSWRKVLSTEAAVPTDLSRRLATNVVDILQRPPSGEFRQVATVFINFQSLWSRESAPQFQEALFQLIEKYDGYFGLFGRIGSLDTGCTLLLFWGAPKNHENDLSRALSFVLELREIAPVPMRVGLTYNLVYAGFAGSTEYTRYTCFGTYVNMAARQVMAAKWGEILLDQGTAREVGPEFTMSEHGWHQFKGFTEQQHIFSLNQRREPTGLSLRRPIVGRQRELDNLWQAIQPIFQSKFGGIITVTGEAGIGKSRLIYELQHVEIQARRSVQTADSVHPGVSWFHCPADEVRHLPLSPFRHFLYRYFNQSETSPSEVNQHYFTEKLNELILATADHQLAAELERTRPFLSALIGLQWEKEFTHHLEPQLFFENELAALKALIKAESLRRPVIVHIEDAHWLDPESIQFIDRLIHNVEAYPFLLLISLRSSQDGGQTNKAEGIGSALAKSLHTVINLSILDKGALYVLATYFLESAVSPLLITLLAERSEGNPFFAEQILLYWQEHSLLQQGDQGWQLLNTKEDLFLHAPFLSANARTVLTARLDQLPTELKDVVKTAAVLGREFDTHILDHMLPDETNLKQALMKAEDANILSAQTSTRYLFSHALLRDAAYDIQLRTQLRTLHRRAAKAIEKVHAGGLDLHYLALIYHYRHSGDVENERIYAHLAAQSAAALYANIEAMQFVSRALELTPNEEQEKLFELLLLREQICNILGDRQQQKQDLETLGNIVHAIADKQKCATYYLRCAFYYRVTNDYSAALSAIDQASQLASELQDAAIHMECHSRRGRTLFQMGDYVNARVDLNATLHMAQDMALPQEVADSMSHLGSIDYYEAKYPEAQAHFQNALALYKKLGFPKGEIHCRYMFSVILYKLGHYTEAQQELLQALEISQVIGWQHSEIFIQGQLGNNYFEVGDYESSQSYHHEAHVLCKEINDLEGEAMSLDTLGLIAFFQERPYVAQRLLQAAKAIQQDIGDKHGLAYSMTHLGFAQLRLNDLNSAYTTFQESIRLRQDLGEEAATIDSRIGLALAKWRLNKTQEAIDEAKAVVEWIAQNGADGIELPVYVCLLGYKLLMAATSSISPYREFAQSALRIGCEIVQSRAENIQDEHLRRTFLDHVPYNREITVLSRSTPNSGLTKENSSIWLFNRQTNIH